MEEPVAPIEDLLRDPLRFVWYHVADAPVRYRALEFCGQRFAWTVPPFLRPRARWTLPQHYALVLELAPSGIWRVLELKPFEWPEAAERWARALWRDAMDAARRRPGEVPCAGGADA